MNPVTLERLIKNCVETTQKHSESIDKLEDFCNKNWGFRFHDIGDMGNERINGSVNYGEYTISVDEFREIMDKAKKENDHYD